MAGGHLRKQVVLHMEVHVECVEEEAIDRVGQVRPHRTLTDMAIEPHVLAERTDAAEEQAERRGRRGVDQEQPGIPATARRQQQ